MNTKKQLANASFFVEIFKLLVIKLAPLCQKHKELTLEILYAKIILTFLGIFIFFKTSLDTLPLKFEWWLSNLEDEMNLFQAYWDGFGSGLFTGLTAGLTIYLVLKFKK